MNCYKHLKRNCLPKTKPTKFYGLKYFWEGFMVQSTIASSERNKKYFHLPLSPFALRFHLKLNFDLNMAHGITCSIFGKCLKLWYEKNPTCSTFLIWYFPSLKTTALNNAQLLKPMRRLAQRPRELQCCAVSCAWDEGAGCVLRDAVGTVCRCPSADGPRRFELWHRPTELPVCWAPVAGERGVGWGVAGCGAGCGVSCGVCGKNLLSQKAAGWKSDR